MTNEQYLFRKEQIEREYRDDIKRIEEEHTRRRRRGDVVFHGLVLMTAAVIGWFAWEAHRLNNNQAECCSCQVCE